MTIFSSAGVCCYLENNCQEVVVAASRGPSANHQTMMADLKAVRKQDAFDLDNQPVASSKTWFRSLVAPMGPRCWIVYTHVGRRFIRRPQWGKTTTFAKSRFINTMQDKRLWQYSLKLGSQAAADTRKTKTNTKTHDCTYEKNARKVKNNNARININTMFPESATSRESMWNHTRKQRICKLHVGGLRVGASR